LLLTICSASLIIEFTKPPQLVFHTFPATPKTKPKQIGLPPLSNKEVTIVTDEQKRKAEVLTFSGVLRTAKVFKVSVSYSGDGDEGHSGPPQFQDPEDDPFDESNLPSDLDTGKLSDLLECFIPEGHENGYGGHGTVTINVQAGDDSRRV
jgi:hypothetical protein